MTFEYVMNKYQKRLKYLIYTVGADRNSPDVEELTTVMRALNKMCARPVAKEEDGLVNGEISTYNICPNCGHRLGAGKKDKHCVHCGQKIKYD